MSRKRRSFDTELHAVLCAAGYNLRWILRAVVRLGLKALFALWLLVQMLGRVVINNERSWPPDGQRKIEYFRTD